MFESACVYMPSPLRLHDGVFDQWLILPTSEQERFHYETKQTNCILPEGSEKSFRSLMNASLHWIYWMMNFHVQYLAFAVFRKIAQELTGAGAGGLTQPNEDKIFSCSQKQDEWTWSIKIRSERAFQNLFSACALIQPDVTTEHSDRLSSSIGSCCALFIVHALCSRAAQVIWRPETRAFEDEPTKYGKLKEMEAKMNFSFSFKIWML